MPVTGRQNPSARYRQLLELYRQMHTQGERFRKIPAEKTFRGESLMPHVQAIKKMIDKHAAKTILDYGSGKGKQYEGEKALPDGRRIPSVAEYWNVGVTCYDPAYERFSELPTGRFDGVVSTDVLEHCPEEDVPWILEEMFSFAGKFLFFNVACFPAAKRLPNGENAHCTVRSRAWWSAVIEPIARRHPGVEVVGIYSEREDQEGASDGKPLSLMSQVATCVRERRLPMRVTNWLSQRKSE